MGAILRAVLIPLRARDGAIRAHAVIDRAETWVAVWPWCLSGGYAVRRGCDGRRVYLHRELLGLTAGDGLYGDHISGDRLDCRHSNLRVVTPRESAQNVRRHGGYSKHRGVTWHRRARRWQAQGQLDGWAHYLGLFDHEEDAAEAVAVWRRDHMPFAEAA